MALKPFRSQLDGKVEVGYFITSTGQQGQLVFAATTAAPVGMGLDDTNSRVEVVNAVSGRVPVGLLLDDVVNIDLSKYALNTAKNEVQIGSKASIATEGEFVTNCLGAGAAPATGVVYPTNAFAGPSGFFFHQAGFVASGYPLVGKFLTGRDSEGFAKISIGLRN